MVSLPAERDGNLRVKAVCDFPAHGVNRKFYHLQASHMRNQNVVQSVISFLQDWLVSIHKSYRPVKEDARLALPDWHTQHMSQPA